MALDRRYDSLPVDRATNIHKWRARPARPVKSYRQMKRSPGGSPSRHAPTNVPRNQLIFFFNNPSRLQPWSELEGHGTELPKMIN